jgi:hypothetical protein
MSQDWWTHPEIIACVHELYGGPPDLDPMSCAEANEIVQAKVYYTKEMNGLAQPWSGRMLLNPPWGGSSATAAKKLALGKLLQAYESGRVAECVCVLNANAVTTAWFSPLLRFPICIPSRRIPHTGPGGKGGSPNSGTVIVYVGPRVGRFSEVFSRLGTVMVRYGKAA